MGAVYLIVRTYNQKENVRENIRKTGKAPLEAGG